jgi:uncharacterized protein (TIGR03435 family)
MIPSYALPVYHGLNMRAPLIGAFVALNSGLAVSQIAAQGPPKEEFEVAAIRPFDQGPGPGFPVGVKGGPGTADPTRMTFTNYSITNMIVLAYSLKYYQLTAPDWTNNKEGRYNIEARVRPGATREDANEMIKNLLADRFKLVLRRETKEMPVQVITIAKGGPKLKEAVDDPASRPMIGRVVMARTGSHRVTAKGKTIEDLADTLTTRQITVLDKTGLTKKYDFTLEYAASSGTLSSLRQQGLPAPAEDAAPEFPELPRAMQEQLGLKIDATKAPIEIFTVESVSKTPTEN